MRSKISSLKKPLLAAIIFYFCTHYDHMTKTLRKPEFR